MYFLDNLVKCKKLWNKLQGELIAQVLSEVKWEIHTDEKYVPQILKIIYSTRRVDRDVNKSDF
jgi:hypothetical protein